MKDTQAIFSAMLESKKSSAKSARKVESTKRLMRESDAAPEEFEGTLLKAQAGEEAVMDDIIDNIQVVTDPEKTVDELENRADAVQDAIEDAPDGEEAFSDEYVGDKVYACPVCGESFFAEEDYEDGDACPICKAEPTNGFLLQGVVAPVKAGEEEVPAEDDEIPAEDEGEVVVDDETPAEGIDEFDDEPEDDDAKEESIKKAGKVVKECDEPECEPAIEVTIDLDDNEIEVTKPAELDVEIDEDSFEDTLNQFAAENYSDAIDEIKVTDASYDPAGDELCLDCVAECKNGKKVPMQFKMKESKCRDNRAILLARECKNALKVESKAPAFSFQVRNDNGTIKCESFKYNFTTTHSKAGKVKVEGYCRAKKVRV